MSDWFRFNRSHLLIVTIIAVATWLRVTHLSTHAIFFGDAAHDLLIAMDSVDTAQIPLLGIESSVPRFRQGPVTIWIEMVTYFLFGRQLLIFSLVFAVIGIAAVIGTYELIVTSIDRRAAWVASLLLAASPLAVAHSRMPYHINPIPLMMVIFLWAAQRLWHQKPWGVFTAGLSWALLFQFELATAPLIGVVAWIIWQRQIHIKTKRFWLEALGSLGLGLAPQLLYDVTHGFSQLGGFSVWAAYRLASSLTGGSHGLSLARLDAVLTATNLYVTRIFSFDQPVITLIVLSALALTIYVCLHQWRNQTLPNLMKIILMSTLTLSTAFLIHGGPSEAYFPPFIILLPSILGYGASLLKPRLYWPMVGLISIWAVMNTVSLYHYSFLVSNQQRFSYGPGSGEQRAIGSFLHDYVGSTIQLRTTQPGGTFANYFDNFRFFAQEQGWQEEPTGRVVFIEEAASSPLATYPDIIKVPFTSVDVYVVSTLAN